ncbi:hypothetical protein C9374_003719 [Naegleria lovaniensis]|uniref:Generative cell specific-1/HAP2 domain-containing protein n=1 Tax=Naegleria lovaniensis TaxID=51637 RepID=A0AA88KYF4_NAELO|nr:uncharacterized protein C9374_003719 [Naegleria lovaniensis]KAG2393955.1 hypothetical protein C9374_003719 [Naegleria lovaniensis]
MVGIDNERSRGNLNCGFLQMKSSAHCMRLHEVDWDGYEIEPFTTKFEITVDLGILGKAKVSPFTKVATLNSGGSVALNGDFSQYKALPTFESKMLFVPAYPKNHPIVLEGSKNWMLVDKNMVTMSGSECDKIGVSFSAFRNQPNACSQLPLSCLGNQLEDLRQTDIALMKEGSRSGKYIISNFGSFLMNSTGAQKTLIMDTSEDTNSVLTIFVNAASVQFLSQKSAGHIVSAFVKPFVAMSKEGEMQITVSNTGTSECSYIITITDCSENILPILQQRVVITPAETVTEHFEIRTSHEFATSNRCKVTLLYSDGEKIQDIIVVFDSKDYAFEKAIDGSIDQTGKVNIEGDHSNSQCKCNSPFDVICIVLHSCIDYIIGWVAAIVGIITIPIIFVFMWRCGLFGLLFQSCKCCACCCSLLPRGIMKCLIGPYKKKKHRRKSKKSKKKRNSSENSERKSKKKKKQRKNRYRNSMRMNDSLPYHPSSYVMMNPQSMARYFKPSPSYEMKEIEYEPVARYYK